MDEEKYRSVVSFIKDNLTVDFSLDCLTDTIRTRRGLQHFASLKIADEESQTIYENILKHAFMVESNTPGGGLLFLRRIVSSTSKDTNDALAHIRNKSDLFRLIQSKKYKRSIESMLFLLLEFSSSDTKISIKKSASSSSYIEISEGFTFEVKPLLKDDPFEISAARVFCIDGYIESVSEIHHLLENLSTQKVPCFLFVRGLSEDVLHTIKVNNNRKTLMLFPYVVPYDVDNVNVLVDIAVASNTDVVSSLKGQLISSIDMSSFGTFDHVIANREIIRARCDASKQNVKRHIETLKSTYEEKSDIVAHVYEKRMKSLTTSCIDVCIPDDMSFFSDSQQLDEGIRIISSIVNKKYDVKNAVDAYLMSYEKTSKDAVRLFTAEN